MGKSNYPNVEIDNLPAEYVSETIESVQELAALGKITRDADMDGDFEERVKMIIDFCKRKGLRPGIETLCAGLGVSRQELHNWENGVGNVSKRRQDGVKQIKQLIYSFLEQCGMSGRLNPTVLIWLQKNWMGYTDVIKIDTSQENNQNTPTQSREEIAARYAQFKDLPEPEKPDLE